MEDENLGARVVWIRTLKISYSCVRFAEVFERLNQVHRETRGAAAVNDPMIVGERERQHQSRLDLLVAHDCSRRPAAEAEDGNFGLVDDRSEMRAADAALVGDGERAPFQLFGRNLAGAGFLRQSAQVLGQFE